MVLGHLKTKRAPPPRGLWQTQDPHYIFARLGQSGKLPPLVITQIRHSLVSEKLAIKLASSKDGWTPREIANWNRRDDLWKSVDVSWPYDTEQPVMQPDGSVDCFEAKRVRFLIVPDADMPKGIVLAQKELKGHWLYVAKGSFRTYLAVDDVRDVGILLHSFPKDTLKVAATDEPLRRLCQLATYAAMRKPKKNASPLFRHQIMQEARGNQLRGRSHQRSEAVQPARPQRASPQKLEDLTSLHSPSDRFRF